MRPIPMMAALASILCATAANATLLDLSTGLGASGYINDAYFLQGTLNPAGTGTYDPFLRLQRVDTEDGFNTSADKVLDNKSGIWTRDLRADETSTVEVKGKKYREFRLDINEASDGNNDKNDNSTAHYLSLDELRLYLKPTGGISSLTDLTYPFYEMGRDSNNSPNWVLLDYNLNKGGSGWDDMSLFIPDELFAASKEMPYLYLYSKFGVQYSADGGFEEWATETPATSAAPVPEPSSLLLLAVGAGTVAFLKRRRM